MLVHHQKLLDREPRNRHMRMIGRVAEHVEHQHAVDHGWEDRADAVFAVEVLDGEGSAALMARWRVGRRLRTAGSIARSTWSTPRRTRTRICSDAARAA